MAEKERKPDRRVVKTKRAIRNAFAKLLCEKDIDKITIKDIADTADINRKTFYNYYSGVYQIIDEIENEVIDNIETALEDINGEEYLKDPYEVFDRITQAVNQDLDFYGYLMSMNSNVSLFSKLVDLLKEKTKQRVIANVDADNERLSIIIEYAISGMISAYRSWFNSDRRISLEETSRIIARIFYDGVNDFISDFLPENA